MTSIGPLQGAASVDSNSSNFTRSIEGGRIIPGLSPLGDKNKLRLSESVDAVATGLASTGFNVGWNNGSIQISPKLPSLKNQDGNSAAIDAFLNPKLTSSKAVTFRPRTQSSITFSKASGNFRDDPYGERTNSASLPDVDPHRARRTRSLCPPGSSRFPQLSASVDSVEHIKKLPPGFNRANLSSMAASDVLVSVPRVGSSGSARAGGQEAEQDGTKGPRTPNILDVNTERGCATPGSVASLRSGVSAISGIRPKKTHPMTSFKPSRSHAFIVFSDVDKAKNGKITKSQLESVALSLGLSEEQAGKLFDRIDSTGRGYINVTDWGKPEVSWAIERFSLMYMQKFLGLPDISATDEQVKRYWEIQSMRQAKNVGAAINLVRISAGSRSANAVGTGNVVYDAFRFMDVDGSGTLSADEVKDGFAALGVKLSEEVTNQLFKTFDKDGNGSIEYHEFLATLFPSRRV